MSGPRLKWTDRSGKSLAYFCGIQLTVDPVVRGFGWEVAAFEREGVKGSREEAKVAAEKGLLDYVNDLAARAARELGE